VLSGFFAFFGSLNAAVPFLLDLFRIPADTFELFLATNVVNARFGTLVAATHTLAVGLLGSAAIAGKLQWQPKRLIRFAVLTAATIIGLRVGFATYLLTPVDGRALVNSLEPLVTPAVDAGLVIQSADVADDSIPREDHVLADIRARGVLRVGLIADVIPYQYRNDRSQVVGFDIEMAQSLAADLGVGVQFVRFPFDELSAQVHARRVDIVMAGARLTPNRAADFATSEPYVEETLAIVTPDHRRGEFHSWQAIHDMGTVRLGVQNLPYYVNAIRRLLPEAELSVIPDTRELIDPNAPYDAYVLPAERGSVLTMLNPRFSVVVPEGATIRMPLAYPLAGHDPSWIRFVNTWIGLKKGEGLVDSLYAHWIMGRGAKRKPPRWSIIRNVLHWVD
jgi:ABC-type amino acid transport substrate-binding protein